MDNQIQQRFNTMSILGFILALYSIILGALSWLVLMYDIRSSVGSVVESSFFYIPLTSLAAVIMGIVSLRTMKKNNQRGKTVAILSIILGALAFVPFLLLLFALIGGASVLKLL